MRYNVITQDEQKNNTYTNRNRKRNKLNYIHYKTNYKIQNNTKQSYEQNIKIIHNIFGHTKRKSRNRNKSISITN